MIPTHHNPMADFKPVFAEIRSQIKRHAAYNLDWRLVRKLKPGETMEARIAARAEDQNGIIKKHAPHPILDPSGLLTAHRHLRGKPSNHTKGDPAKTTEFVVGQIRKILERHAATQLMAV